MNERYSLGASNIYFPLMSAFKIPQVLLVLAKEIFEWCLVAEDIIMLCYHRKLYIHNFWFQKVYMWKMGSGG